MFSWFYTKRREIDEDCSVSRSLPVKAVESRSSAEVPLAVVLNGQLCLKRPRLHTRLASQRPVVSGSRLSLPVGTLPVGALPVGDSVNAQLALSIGIMASELGIGTIKAQAPKGYNAIESLRLLRAACLRFNLSLVYEVRSEEEGLEVAHWCDMVELSAVRTPGESFLRHLDALQVALSLVRTTRLEKFLEIVSSTRRIFTGSLNVLERASGGSCDYGAIARLSQHRPVVVELGHIPSLNEESIALSALGLGAAGVDLSMGLSDELSGRFNEVHRLLRKIAAIQATLRAIKHV